MANPVQCVLKRCQSEIRQLMICTPPRCEGPSLKMKRVVRSRQQQIIAEGGLRMKAHVVIASLSCDIPSHQDKALREALCFIRKSRHFVHGTITHRAGLLVGKGFDLVCTRMGISINFNESVNC